jgi:hypothetical protein
MNQKIIQWAIRHGVSHAALAELHAMFVSVGAGYDGAAGGLSESAVSNIVTIEASRKGARLWRNNVGACTDKTGRTIRYGLANQSPKLNKVFKSSDRIGIKPVYITDDMVGSVMGQFLAREIKPSGWVFTGDEHEMAQLAFLEFVVAMGGDACFASGEGTL